MSEPRTTYDQVVQHSTGTGGVTLGGKLNLLFVDGFESTVQNSDTFTILTSDLALNGGFTNVANGGRLHTTNGSSSFVVNYNGNNVVLSGFLPSPLALTFAVSGKVHGAVGSLDIPLPLAQPFGIESRSSAISGNHTLVFTFSNTITSGTASVTGGTGSVVGTPLVSGNTLRVDLTGVTNQQTVTVTLSNVTDTLSQVLPNTAVSMHVLLGDSNGDGSVNSGDSTQVRSRSGQVASVSNVRSDVNSDGTVNSGDATIVRSRSGTSILPPAISDELTR